MPNPGGTIRCTTQHSISTVNGTRATAKVLAATFQSGAASYRKKTFTKGVQRICFVAGGSHCTVWQRVIDLSIFFISPTEPHAATALSGTIACLRFLEDCSFSALTKRFGR